MSIEKYYSVIVPVRHIAPAYEGKLNNDTGLPEGELAKVHPELGWIHLSNYSKVWGKRVKGADKKPNGKIEFLKWGTEGGEAIDLRYLPNSTSIDKQYQINVEKLVIPNEVGPQGEVMDLRLRMGVNDFDVSEDPALVEMLKNHSMNSDAIGRNPRLAHLFSTYNESANNKVTLEERRRRKDASDLAFDARENKQLIVLAHIFGLDAKSLDADIHDQLMDMADGQNTYKSFISQIEDFKANAERNLSEAVEAGIIRNQEGSEVTIIKGSQAKPLLKDVMQEGDSIVNFFVANILNEDYYNAYKEVEMSLEKAKQLLLD